MMRSGSLLALSKILGHAKISMTEKYAHLARDHLRAEIATTERAWKHLLDPATHRMMAVPRK